MRKRKREYELLTVVLNLKCFVHQSSISDTAYNTFWRVFKATLSSKSSTRLIMWSVLVKIIRRQKIFCFGFWIIKLNIFKHLFIKMRFFNALKFSYMIIYSKMYHVRSVMYVCIILLTYKRSVKNKLKHIYNLKSWFEQKPTWIGQCQTRSG